MAGIQVVRVESYTRSAMSGVGREQLRDSSSVCRNADIDPSRTILNVALKSPAGGSIGSAWHTAFNDIEPGYKARKDGGVMDQLLVTSGPEFFAELGWESGMGLTPQMDQFFQDTYAWVIAQVGFEGTDRNILAATVHLDETTPHMHVAYIPIAEKRRSVVYEKDENGVVRRNAKGSPIKAKDEQGKVIYRIIEEPRLSHTEFWGFYGGAESEYVTGRRNISYSLLQDRFHADVGERWGLERGEVGSDARHESHHKRRAKKAKRELKAVEEQTKKAVQTRDGVQEEIASLTAQRDDLDTGIEIRTSKVATLDERISAKQNELSRVQVEGKKARVKLNAIKRRAQDESAKNAADQKAGEAKLSSINKKIATAEGTLAEVKTEVRAAVKKRDAVNKDAETTMRAIRNAEENHAADRDAWKKEESDRTAELSQLDNMLLAARQELSDVKSETKANHDRNAKEREELDEALAQWNSSRISREAEDARLGKSIAEKKHELAVVEELLGDVAHAADLQLTELPQGKRSITGSKVTYTLEDNDRLHRLANTGLVSHRLEEWYRDEQQKRQISETQVTQLKAHVAELNSEIGRLSSYKKQASRVPDLVLELQATRNELKAAERKIGSLEDKVAKLTGAIVDLMGVFAHKVRGALGYIREKLSRRGLKWLVPQIKQNAKGAEELDIYVAQHRTAEKQGESHGKAPARKQYSSGWDR